jgi:predicted ATPase
MHIKKFTLENIRGIEKLEVQFKKTAGWHVFIGDNGSGKTTILRSIALAILGEDEARWLRPNWRSYIRNGAISASISVELTNRSLGRPKKDFTLFQGQWDLHIKKIDSQDLDINHNVIDTRPIIIDVEEGSRRLAKHKFFSASFGAFRRLTNSKSKYDSLEGGDNLAIAHHSLFDDSITLQHNIAFLQDLDYQRYESTGNNLPLLGIIKQFVNQTKLLPDGVYLDGVTSSGLMMYQNEEILSLADMSDGTRTTLGLVLEILRLQVLHYGKEVVSQAFIDDNTKNNITGLVMIDEAALHLHPTWQTKIGGWFTSVFPKIQFIVTTHSPLICRAAEDSTIWKLSTPGSEEDSHQVMGTAFKRLVYGNVLDAFGTQLFGKNTTSSDKSTALREEYARLHQRSLRGDLSDEQRDRMYEIQSIMPTEDITE